MPKIKVTISKDGTSTLFDAQGFSGEKCSNPIEALSKAVGTVTDGDKKPEFYELEREITCEGC